MSRPVKTEHLGRLGRKGTRRRERGEVCQSVQRVPQKADVKLVTERARGERPLGVGQRPAVCAVVRAPMQGRTERLQATWRTERNEAAKLAGMVLRCARARNYDPLK